MKLIVCWKKSPLIQFEIAFSDIWIFLTLKCVCVCVWGGGGGGGGGERERSVIFVEVLNDVMFKKLPSEFPRSEVTQPGAWFLKLR